MKSLKNISNTPMWQDLVPKIEPSSCFLLNGPGTDYVLAWGKDAEISYNLESFSFPELDNFIVKNKGNYIFGYLTYDLKNCIEKQLSSKNNDVINFPLASFIVAKHVLICKNNTTEYFGEWTVDEINLFLNTLLKQEQDVSTSTKVELKARTSKEDYFTTFEKIKSEIQFGNIYEMNYCLNFFQTAVSLHSFSTYKRLEAATIAPFSCYFSLGDHSAMVASPERYLKKEGQKLISQPIKGTAARGANEIEDAKQKELLKNDPKEQAENVMIVDLVRNDLSKIATKNSVQVDELFGVYTFKTVHQLISTISCELKKDVSFSEIIQATFPMGSMTGAPKIKAMELSEKFENFKRGLYSGAIGYIKPNGDFDFNVVIRSILHNKKEKTVSCSVGGAITINAQPEKEYDECLLKLSALQKALC